MPKFATAHKEHINKYKMAHNIGVAEYMRERAEDYGIDPNVAYTVGLLHDVGYLYGRSGHEEKGAAILRKMGCNDDIVEAVELHGGNLQQLSSKGEEITPLLVLTVEADSSVDVLGYRVGFEGRLADIEQRYGKDSNAYRTVTENIAYIKEFQKGYGIGKPVNLYHKEGERK